jgi:hypothetical protein
VYLVSHRLVKHAGHAHQHDVKALDQVGVKGVPAELMIGLSYSLVISL